MVRAPVLAAVAALLVAGCGSDETSQPPPALSAPQANGLVTRIDRIRVAAGAGDLELTQQRLRGFRREVARLRTARALDAPTARALATGAERAARQAATEVVPPQPLPAPEETDEKGKQKKKHGKGKGRFKDEEGDD